MPGSPPGSRQSRGHRLRSLAEAVDRADGWLTLGAAARTGQSPKQPRAGGESCVLVASPTRL